MTLMGRTTRAHVRSLSHPRQVSQSVDHGGGRDPMEGDDKVHAQYGRTGKEGGFWEKSNLRRDGGRN